MKETKDYYLFLLAKCAIARSNNGTLVALGE